MRTRSLMVSLATLVLLAMLSACGGSDSEDMGGDLQEPAPLASEPVPELDVEMSQADTPAGAVDAERAGEETYVGEVTEDLYISVALDEGIDAAGPQQVLVYVCDGQHAEYLLGEIGMETATLEGEALDVELSLADGVVSGAVILDDEEPRPFTANEASGDAGLYAASFDFEGYDYRPVWVVLPDGSQRGGACWQCCDGERCYVCCPTTAETAGPTVDWSELQYWWRKWVE